EFAEKQIGRILDGLPDLMGEVNRRGGGFAGELREAHRRGRRTTDQAVGGVKVTMQGEADILGRYVYRPVAAGPAAGSCLLPPPPARSSPLSALSARCCPPTCSSASRTARKSPVPRPLTITSSAPAL